MQQKRQQTNKQILAAHMKQLFSHFRMHPVPKFPDLLVSLFFYWRPQDVVADTQMWSLRIVNGAVYCRGSGYTAHC